MKMLLWLREKFFSMMCNEPSLLFSKKEKDEFVRKMIMQFSRGNIYLSLGRFKTKEELEEERRRAREIAKNWWLKNL